MIFFVLIESLYFRVNNWSRYLVICPAKMLAEKEDKQMAQVCMDDIQLESDKYRLGHTKAGASK